MSRSRLLLVAAAVVLGAAPVKAENPLLEKWTGPYGGVPPFDKVKVADFKPALESAMAANLKEIEAIAKNPAKPDFENTIAAFERAGKPLERASAIYGVFRSTMSTDDFQKVETEMAPKLADRKSTRLNSSHSQISYAVFCLKKKKIKRNLYSPSFLPN